MRASVLSAGDSAGDFAGRTGDPALFGAQRPVLAGALRLLLLAVLLGAFALRLQELTRQNIWWDEARNIDVALRPFWQIPTAPELDIQPPVYYWLLHAWNGLFGVAIGQPPDALALASRLFSVFAGVVGVALLFPLARRVLPPGLGTAPAGNVAGVIAALAGAASPFWLAESQEARMYTVGFALLAGAALALLRHVANQDDDRHRVSGRYSVSWVADLPALAAFVVLAAAALLTHYNAVFVLVTWFGWWGIWALRRHDRWRQLASLLGAGLALALLALPMLPIALRQIPDYENPNITIPGAGDYLWQNWQAYAGGYAFDGALPADAGAAWLWLLLAFAAVGVGVAAWRAVRGAGPAVSPALQPAAGATHGTAQQPIPHPDPHVGVRTGRLERLTFLLAWLLGALALYYVAVLDRNAFNVRYASFVTPALYALLGVGLAAYGRWGRLLAVLGATVLLLGMIPSARADLYDPRFDREHTAEVAAWLRANTGPGDVIFVDQKYPFGFYYQPFEIPKDDGSAGLAASGRAAAAGADEGPLARYLFVDINKIDQRLTELAGDARRVFWLQWFESDTDPRKAVRFLLDKYGRQAGEQAFQGYTLAWWELDPPTAFELAPELQPLRLAFPPAAETVAVSVPTAPVAAGDPLPVAIRWGRTAGEPPVKSLKARVALYDASGGRLVQADERLLNDRHRAPVQWENDDQPLNVYLLSLPSDLPAGTYSLGLLVYDADTLEQVGAEATLGTVEVKN